MSNLRWWILKTLLKTFCCLLAFFRAFLSLTFVSKVMLYLIPLPREQNFLFHCWFGWNLFHQILIIVICWNFQLLNKVASLAYFSKKKKKKEKKRKEKKRKEKKRWCTFKQSILKHYSIQFFHLIYFFLIIKFTLENLFHYSNSTKTSNIIYFVYKIFT